MAKAKEARVREAVGVFSDADQLKTAIDELLQTGFERDQLGILASEHAVKEGLGEFYDRTNETHEPEKAPAIAFVSRDSVGEIGESMGGSLYFIGTSAVAGTIVASSAILGGALVAAVGGIVGVGLVGLMVAAIIHQSDADELQQRVDEGHILLFVRLPHSRHEQQAKDILARHSATDVKVHEVPVKAGEYVAAD